MWRFCGHCSGGRMGESFDNNELSVYLSVIVSSEMDLRELCYQWRERQGLIRTNVPSAASPPFEDQQLCLSDIETLAHTWEQWALLSLFTSGLIVTRRLEPRPLTCTAKRWSVINFVLPGQTLQHFPSTFWGYLQGYCSGQWIFLHSCLVMLQVHNTHSTIPKARRLGCQDSPCEYVLPFETHTTKEEKRKKKYNWKRYIPWLCLWIFIWFIHICLKQCLCTSFVSVSCPFLWLLTFEFCCFK